MRKRRLLLLVLLVVGALSACVIWMISFRERLLTEVAQAVMKVDVEQTSICWLSVHRLLLVTTKREPSTVVNPQGNFVRKNWQGTADVFDTTTHKTNHLTALTNLLNHDSGYAMSGPNRLEVSLDGVWLLWETDAEGDGWPHPHAAHLDGTHYREWGRNRNEDKFFLDSQHLVQMNQRDPTMVRDLLNPENDRQYPTAAQTLALLAPYAVRHPVFVTISSPEEAAITDVVDVETYRITDRLQRIRSEVNEWKDAPEPIQKWTLYLTVGATYQSAAVSPQQQSAFYVLTTSRLPPVLIWLKRLFPKFAPKPRLTEELWVVGADGRGEHEIGAVPTGLDANGNPDAVLKDVRWLPDGKQISFTYQGTLYVLPPEVSIP